MDGCRTERCPGPGARARSRPRRYGAALLASALLLFAAGAEAGGVDGAPPAPIALTEAVTLGPGKFSFDLLGRPLVPRGPADPLLSGSVGVGTVDGALSYRASYALDSGDILATHTVDPGKPLPRGIAGHRRAHRLAARLPVLAGAPMTVALTQEVRQRWTLDGLQEERRESAQLRWALAGAAVDLRYAGPRQAVDETLSIDCGLRATVSLTLSAPGTPSAGNTLRLTARECDVLSSDQRYVSLGARTVQLAHLWAHARGTNRIALALIDPQTPRAASGSPARDIAASLQLGLGHERRMGLWQARAEAWLRRVADHPAEALAGAPGDSGGTTDLDWTADATVSRELPAGTVSVSWSHGTDPLWFLPGAGRAADRFAMGVDLSRWIGDIVYDVKTQLKMDYSWWQTREAGRSLDGDSVLRVSLSMAW